MLAGEDYRSGKPYPKLIGVCPMCDTESVLVVDHCHQHGRIRGRICPSCNVRLGFVERRELANGYATIGSYGPEILKQLRLCDKCEMLYWE
jgi:uncharacterized protein with PIN domain